MRPSWWVIAEASPLSNVSAEQVDAVLAAYRAKGFDMSHVDSMGDWALLVGRRNG